MAKPACKSRRPGLQQIQIKEESEDPQQGEEDNNEFDLPSPSEIFRLPSRTSHIQRIEPSTKEISQEDSQEINQEIGQEIGQQVSQEVSQEEPNPYHRRRRRVFSNASLMVSPPRTRRRHQLNPQDYEHMQASGPTPQACSGSRE